MLRNYLLQSLSDKYELITTFKDNNICSVRLVRHVSLGALRVIKSINKSLCPGFRTLREAYILKSLSHPSIPMIYDIEEDDTYIHIIEEFIEGDSLQSRILTKKHLSPNESLFIAISICETVLYLHTLPTPVYHLDIKPENIIISGNVIKLIDFGNAIKKGEAVDKPTGTTEYAPKEQFTQVLPQPDWDIYAIGALLRYMLGGSSKTGYSSYTSLQLQSILDDCLADESANRISNVKELLKRLKKLSKRECLSLRIVVAGVKHGIGTTYVATALTRELSRQGYTAIYEEFNNSGDCGRMIRKSNAHFDIAGTGLVKGCPMRPNYSLEVSVSYSKDYEIHVIDAGTLTDKPLADGDYTLLIGSTADHTIDKCIADYTSLSQKRNVFLICNLCEKNKTTLQHITGISNIFPFQYNVKKQQKSLRIIIKKMLPKNSIFSKIRR